jgi:phosphopantothenoylcysteine decarboxylase / phosphopantothenate---cysteine ligase
MSDMAGGPPSVGAGRRPSVVLGVAGGIAAYKAAELLRRFTETGHDVTVVPTPSALHFVGEATWAALSGKPVTTQVWESVHQVPHVRIGQSADLVVVAPATADLLARAAHGRADDLLTNVLLTARCPVVFAPAMHTEMWEHPATQENVATLRRRGAVVVEPAVGRLTGVDTGKGRLPDPGEIFEVCRRVLTRGVAEPDLAGRHVVVSAGGTREPLDAVRFVGNRSSGRMGVALAAEARRRGAEVTLLAANLAVPAPPGVELVETPKAADLEREAIARGAEADVVVMAAAVADYRPAEAFAAKRPKDAGTWTLELEPTTDVLSALGERRRDGQLLVGFAAETGATGLERAREKLSHKRADLFVLNDVGRTDIGFDTYENEVTLLTAAGGERAVPKAPKDEIAAAILDEVEALLGNG